MSSKAKAQAMEEGLAERAREFYRYYPHGPARSLELSEPVSDVPQRPQVFPPRPSEDKALTAFAQLGALRLNTRRCIISFFDRNDCFLLAEATRTLFIQSGEVELEADRPCWGPTVFPKEQSICHYTVSLVNEFTGLPAHHYGNVPSLVVNDLTKDDRFKHYPFVTGPPYSRFYAGVPIRSPSGHNIGTYCVLDETPRDGLSPAQLDFLKDMGTAVMHHLEMTRATEDHRRGKIMVKSLGSFAEGKSEQEKWWQDPWESEQPATPTKSLKVGQDKVESNPSELADSAPASVTSLNGSASTPPTSSDELIPDSGHSNADTTATPPNDHKKRVAPEIKATFSRAADMIVRATEVDGAAFFDAKISTFGGLVDDDILFDHPEPDKPCVVLGASLNKNCSGDTNGSDNQYSLSETVLRHLLKTYKHGHIFNFDDDNPSTFSSISSNYTETEMSSHHPYSMPRRTDSIWSRSDEDMLRSFFPRARSLILYPLWDARRDRWFASAVIWSLDPMRIFTSEQELSYLAAFSNSVMAEVARLDTKLADTAKADFISSISHELRSPLHGILGMTDLLKDTEIDNQQNSHVATIETCGKTLLETINHVLDYAKINNLTRGAPRPQNRRSLNTKHMIISGKPHTNDIMTLIDDVDLSTLTEDVVESVCAGYTYAKTAAQTYELVKPQSSQPPVLLILDINRGANYVFRTQPGAWRRVIMNLFGNSLKYTDEGYVKVKLEVRKKADALDDCCDFKLTVTDSGIGMSENYISNRLFHSFAQENPLSQGTGLGLSIVKQIVESLGGVIEVRSEKGRGTKFTISCPLKESMISPALSPERSENDRDIRLRETRERTKGLKVSLVGFHEKEICFTDDLKDKSAIRLSLKALERLCADWFDMEICGYGNELEESDLIIATEDEITKLRAQQSQDASARFKAPILVFCHGPASPQFKVAFNVPGIIYERMNQPIGPHKMARALSSCLDRHTNQTIPPTTEAGSSIPDIALLSIKEDTPSKHPQIDHIIETSRPHIFTASSAPEIHTASPGLLKKTIYAKPTRSLICLCVDDNLINLRLLRTFVNKLGHRHALACNGLEALKHYKASNTFGKPQEQTNRIDVIFMDINMPVMDGLEATRQIRAHELRNGLPKVTIIALTGVGDSEVQNDANSSGINLFLIKPMRLAELEVILKGVVTGQDKADSELQAEKNRLQVSDVNVPPEEEASKIEKISGIMDVVGQPKGQIVE